MSQSIAPLFGAFSTGREIAKAAGNQPGIVAAPTVAFTGDATSYNAVLGINAARGFWAWRTAWTRDAGATLIVEDADVTLAVGPTPGAGAGKKSVLIVGTWAWKAGPLGPDNKPLGTLAEDMKATYSAVAGVAGGGDPTVATPGAVILGRVVLENGKAPAWEWLPTTYLDLAAMGSAIDARMKRVGDERHEGRLKVTATPIEDEEVVRVSDIKSRAVVPYASLVSFWLPIPDTWGTGAVVQAIAGANRKVASGSDCTFNDQNTNLISIATTGIYDVSGTSWGAANCDNHDMLVEVYRRPSGTSGTADELIFRKQASCCTGNADGDIHFAASLAAGDAIYFASVGKRSVGASVIVSFRGALAPTVPMSISTTGWSGMAGNGQVFPKIVTMNLVAQNAVGSVTWAITGGSAQGFSSLVGSVVTMNLPAVGSWTLNVRATDASGTSKDKVLAISLAAYALVPITITTTDSTFTSFGYPYAVEVSLASTGGEAPITWSIVAGADTTLPSAAIAAGKLTGSVGVEGTWKARVKATDSASPTNQTQEKVLNVTVQTYVPPSGGDLGGGGAVCFAPGTYVLLADGSGKLIEDVRPGDEVLTISEVCHQTGHRAVRPAMVTDVLHNPGDGRQAVEVKGIRSTQGHHWAVYTETCEGCQGRILGDWRMASKIAPEDRLVRIADGKYPQEVPAGGTIEIAPLERLINLGTTAGSYCVAASAQGPFFLVHNYNPQDIIGAS